MSLEHNSNSLLKPKQNYDLTMTFKRDDIYQITKTTTWYLTGGCFCYQPTVKITILQVSE
jgi:hypothetical protein